METLFPLYFSSSMFEDIFSCKFRFFRKYCQKIATSRNSDIIAGGHLAKALELTRKAYFNEKVDSEDAISLGFDYILNAEHTGSDLKSNERVAFAFKRHFKKFPLDNGLKPCELANGEFAIEYRFELDLGIPHPELPDRNIIFTGKLDYLGEKLDIHRNLRRYIVDEKSTKNVKKFPGTLIVDEEAEKEEYNCRGQFICYHWAARVLGITTDGTLVHRIPITKEPIDAYELYIPVNDFMIDNWRNSIMSEITELSDRYKYFLDTGVDPRRAFPPVYNNACNDFRRPCHFKQGCLLKEGDEIFELAANQIIRYPEIQDEQKEISLIEYKRSLGL